MTSLVGNVYNFFLESQKMDSDFIASILIKCHKIKGCREIFFFTSWIFLPKSFKWSHWFPVLSNMTCPGWAALETCRLATLSVQAWRYFLQAWKHFFLRPDSTSSLRPHGTSSAVLVQRKQNGTWAVSLRLLSSVIKLVLRVWVALFADILWLSLPAQTSGLQA